MNGGVDYSNSGKEFVYQQPVTVSAILPSSLPSNSAGAILTVLGADFASSSELSCR